MENKICLCCLEKINPGEQSGNSAYHLDCRTHMVVNKAHTFAAGLKLMSVEEIIKNVIITNSCADKFTEEEKQILSKSNNISQMVNSLEDFSNGPNSSVALSTPTNQTSLYSKLEDDIVNDMYNSMAIQSEKFSGLFSKNDFEQVISSSINLIMNDSSAYEEIMQLSMNGSIDSGKVNPSDSVIQKLMSLWPQELKDKFDLISKDTKDTANPFTFNTNAYSDTESEESESDVVIEEVD